MSKINKYLYGWKLYVNYGQGWEYETFEETKQGYLENKKAYRENCPYPQRWVQARELNPEWINARANKMFDDVLNDLFEGYKTKVSIDQIEKN